MPFSERSTWPFEPNRLASLRHEIETKGIPILDLTLTNPTKAGFNYLQPSLLSDLNQSKNLGYDPDPRGLKEARAAVQGYYEKKGVRLSIDQIFLTATTSEAYNFIFRLAAEPGDKVLAPYPSYPLLEYLTRFNDIQSVKYPLLEENPWSFLNTYRGDAAVRAVLAVHPNNPTGHYVSDEGRKALVHFAASKDIPLIVDEVFLDYPLLLPAPSTFAGETAALTFTLSGISKVLGLPQMKLSWIVVNGPQEAVARAAERLEVLCDTFLSPSTPVQNALPDWFALQDTIQGEIKTRIQGNQRLLQKVFSASDFLLRRAHGGWSVPLGLPSEIDDEKFVLDLLEKKGVLVHPGFFYDYESPGTIVVSLLPTQAVFEEGIKRIKELIR